MTKPLKSISVPLREFAVPSPLIGSIEAHSGYREAAAQGRELHQRIQKGRLKSDSAYEAEVTVSGTFEREGYLFRVDGRMDGIFRSETPKIEEIKTAFNIGELHRRLSGSPFEHPYSLQLLTYGYFYWQENAIIPALSFHLVSTRRRHAMDLEIALDIPRYEQWLELRLAELTEEARRAEKRAARRRKIASIFAFPYPLPRPGQTDLMRTVEEGMARKQRMLLQAPTGLGKTVGVLYPVLKEALSRGQKVVYVTPKNSQHSVAEDAVERFQENGAGIKPLSITAKGKICFMSEPVCTPEYCGFARDYYKKVGEKGILGILAKKRKLTARTFRSIGEEYQVCPFELQLDAARDVDVVICDYNYVFAPRSAFGRMSETGIDQEGRPNLVIDEAHNLPSRAMGYYSPALSTLTLENMRQEIRNLSEPFAVEAEKLLDGCIRAVASCRPGGDAGSSRIEPQLEPFLEQDLLLRAFLSRYLESDSVIETKDMVMRLCFYWSEFTEALARTGDPDHPEFFSTFHSHDEGGTIKITCCDASEMLKHCYDEYDQVAAFSATLKPFDYYAKLSGLYAETIATAEFQSPFPCEHRRILIIPQISTKYSDRDRNYPKIADAIQRMAGIHRGNYFAFFPSFEFLERVHALFQPPPGFLVLKQNREMKLPEVEQILDHLREGLVPCLLFAVQGGIFAEGVDYPGHMAIGAFVVGPPLPNFDLEREEMRAYYQKRYDAGFDYAYAVPAMARAVQAAGRVIRSETDRGLIVLMDSRFLQVSYSRAMPRDWFVSDANELVSGTILKDIESFWNNTSPAKK